jgi:hypothetical protein
MRKQGVDREGMEQQSNQDQEGDLADTRAGLRATLRIAPTSGVCPR